MRRLALPIGLAAALLAVASGAASAGDRDQLRGAAQAQAPAPSEQRTYPRVAPHRGRGGTSFAAYFTLRSRPGHQGVMETSYRVAVARAGRSRARCTPPSPDTVQAGAPG